MDYSFPCITHVDQLRQALAGRSEFFFAERDGCTIADYRVCLQDSFPTSNTACDKQNEVYRLRREARGIMFCAETGHIVARRYHKFFNLNELPECALENIDFARPHIILEKLDGSMITPFSLTSSADSGRLRWGTKMGETNVAKPVIDFVAANPQYASLAKHLLQQGKTPILEWCSRQNRIVVDHPVDRLVLTAIRSNISGQYMSYHDMVEMAKEYNIEVVQALEGQPQVGQDVQAFVDMVRQLQDVEGFVVRFDNGCMIKVKTLEYLKLHKIKELFESEKNVWAMILDDKLDDILPVVKDEKQRQELVDFCSQLNQAIINKADEIHRQVTEWIKAHGDDQKKFVLELVNTKAATNQEKTFYFQIKAGDDPISTVRDYVRSKCSSASTLDMVRPIVGGLKWDPNIGDKLEME